MTALDSVDGAELDAEVVAVAPRFGHDLLRGERALQRPLAAAALMQLHVDRVLQRLARDPLGHPAPFGLVGLDEGPSGAAEHEPGELPHGVVHALEAGVHAEAAGRRELVRGVAAQQHAALHEPLGDGGVQLPEPEREHLGLEPVDPDGGADPRPRSLVGEDVERPLRGLHADLAQPAARPVERLEHAARVLVGDEEQHALAVAEVRLDVGPEVAVHDVRQLLRALQLDPELAADQARRAVGRDQGPTR